MPLIFKIDSFWQNIKKRQLRESVNIVSETLSKTYSDIKLFSPIRTWKYLSWHRYKWVYLLKNKVIWEIENIWAYPERVEKWFRKVPVNWRLSNLGQIYFSKGANVYAKALAKNKDNFINKLRWL